MEQPNKDKKKQAIGNPVAGTSDAMQRGNVYLDDEQEKRAIKAKQHADKKTPTLKRTAEAQGQTTDDKGMFKAKPFEWKYIPGKAGQFDRVVDSSGKVIYEDNESSRGKAKKDYERQKQMIQSKRHKAQDVQNFQVESAENSAMKRQGEKLIANDKNKEKAKSVVEKYTKKAK
jgi:hypothetical protein